MAQNDQPGPRRSHSEFRLRASGASSEPPTILVVDDEPWVRLFVERVLRGAGYRVVQAGSAEAALRLLEDPLAPFDLLLSDVGLPGASGAELIKAARRARPRLPTQLMSATSRQHLLAQGLLEPGQDLLQKPFSVGALLARLEQLLPRMPQPLRNVSGG